MRHGGHLAPRGTRSSWFPYSIGNVNWVGGGNPSRYVAKCLSAYFGQEGAIWTNFFCKISMFDIWRLNLCDRFLPGCSHLTAGRLFLQTMSKFILISGITRFRNYSFQALLVSGITRFRNSEFSDSVLVFVRWIIWHQAKGYNWNIMSQILSFLTHITALAVGSITSSHSKISAICWYHFFVWILIPLDGAVIDGDMLSIVLSTFLARSY